MKDEGMFVPLAVLCVFLAVWGLLWSQRDRNLKPTPLVSYKVPPDMLLQTPPSRPVLIAGAAPVAWENEPIPPPCEITVTFKPDHSVGVTCPPFKTEIRFGPAAFKFFDEERREAGWKR